MPKKLISLGSGVFNECPSLQTVDLSRTSIAVVPVEGFAKCTSLTDVKLPETVQVIGYRAFDRCEHLGRINLPEGVCSISDFAFSGCHSLCTIDLPDSLTHIGEQAFDDCIALESIAIPQGITVLEDGVFDGDYKLKTVYLPDSLRVISVGALETSNHYGGQGGESGSGSLTAIHIPSSVEYISDKAFDQSGKMGTIQGQAGSYAEAYAGKHSLKFQEMPKEAKISFDACGGRTDAAEKSAVIGQTYGELPTPELKGYTFTGWYADQKFRRRIKSTTIVKEASLTVYARWEKAEKQADTYQGSASDFTIQNGKLTKYTGHQPVVVVPEGVTEIGSHSFDCDTMAAVILPDSVTKIGSYAFDGCRNLLELDIPKGVTEIPDDMCRECINLKRVNIPEGVTRIGDSAFMCTNPYLDSALQDVSLPDTLQSIGNHAFAYCTSLIDIDLPDSLTEIGASAFRDCYALRKIAVPAGVEVLSREVFADCDALEYILLTDGLKQVQAKVFEGNAAVTSIYIPESVIQMDEAALQQGLSILLKAFTIEGIKGSTAYDYYEGTQNSDSFSKIEVSFQPLSYDASVQFDTQVPGLTADSKKAIVGKCYGLLPVLEQEGMEFCGWSLARDGAVRVKSTDLVEEENTTLYAVWKDPAAEDPGPGGEEEPDGVPTILPSEDEEDPEPTAYTEIASAEELAKIRENLAGNYRLTADIDLSEGSKTGGIYDLDGYGWRPLGASQEGTSEAFTGIFDGAGHTIKGLFMAGEVPYSDVGLFARVEGGTIRNLTLENCTLQIGGSPIRSGILAGYVGMNEGTGREAVIENCAVTGGEIKFSASETVNSKNIAIGGVVGYMGLGTLSDCRNSAQITYNSDTQEKPNDACSRFLGGVAGYLSSGVITRCSNSGPIHYFRNYYGDFTTAPSGDWVASALSGCDVYGIAGGICGVGAANGSILECYNTGSIYAYMINEYNLISLNVTSNVDTMAGGICGALYMSTEVLDCYNTGSVKSYSDRNTTLVDKSAPADDIINSIMAVLDKITVCAPFQNATGYAGGIVGFSTKITSGPVKYCYSTGALAGSKESVHAIANGLVPVAYCRYAAASLKDKDGNEVELLGSSAYGNSLTRCQALTPEQMKLCDSYRSFDFANKWFLADESVLEAPQLYWNMSSKVTGASFLETGALKTEYEYGEKLDLTGLQVSVTLEGVDQPLLMDVPGNTDCGYDAYTPGTQKLVITYFGVSKELEVTVKEPEYEVTVNHGQGSGRYTKGAIVTITADEPEEKKAFDKWTADAGNITFQDENAAQTTFIMGDEPVSVTASYCDLYQVTVNGGEGSGGYKEGDEVTVTAAEAAEGMVFAKWEVSYENSALIPDRTLQTLTFAMPKRDVELTAVYVQKEETVTVNNGQGSGSYKMGETVTITANKPEEKKAFEKWSVDAGSVTLEDAFSPKTTFIMGTEPVSVTAVYCDLYQVKVNGGEGSGNYKAGDEVTVTASEPTEGMEFTGWGITTGEESLIIDKTLRAVTFVMPGYDVELTAEYKQKEETPDPGNPGETPGETPDPGNPGETPDPGNPGETPEPGNPGETPDASIHCKKTLYKTAYGAKPFKINAVSKSKLVFVSSNPKIAAVGKNTGMVTIKNTGIVDITVKTGKVSVKVTVKISPKKQTVKSVKTGKGRKLTVKWAKDKRAAQYQVQISTDKNFKKGVKTKKLSKTSLTFKKLKAGKKYYVRIRSCKKSGKEMLYGSWSKKKQSGKIKK